MTEWQAWTPSRRALNTACLGTADACAAIYWVYDLVYAAGPPPTLAAIGGQVALCLLLVQSTRVLRLIWKLLSYVLPQFLSVSVSVFMIVYVFGLLGMQLFHDLPLTSADERYAHEMLAGCAEPFANLPCTLFILFQVPPAPLPSRPPPHTLQDARPPIHTLPFDDQVMTNEDWHVVLRAMWASSGGIGLAYVLAFFLVVNVCLLSLTTALAINAFLASKTDLLDQVHVHVHVHVKCEMCMCMCMCMCRRSH